MPEIHDPHHEMLLNGAIPTSSNRRRRRRSVHVTGHTHASAKKVPTATSRAPFEALDFDFNNQQPSANSHTMKKTMHPIKEILSPKKKTSAPIPIPKGRKKTKQRSFSPNPSTPSPYKPTLPSFSSQRPVVLPQQHQQFLCAPPSHIRHGLLVDTRTLDTKEGTAVSQSFLHNLRQFLSSMRCRGMAPHVLACLHPLPSGTGGLTPRSRPPMAVKALRVLGNARLTVSVDCFCESLLIQPATNAGNTRNAKAVKVPTRLLAQASWKAFGDLVEEAVKQDMKSSSSVRKVPLTVTLLTNDVALFCDSSNAAAHKPAVRKFWNRIRPLFHKNSLRSIQLMALETGTIRVRDPFGVETHDVEAESNDMDTEVPQASTTPVSASTTVVECAQEIRQYISEFANADYKIDRSREVAVTPISLSLTLLDNNSRSFGILGRRWMAQVVSPPELKGNINFELPETMDGTQCSISLDVRYRLLPYPADSPCVAGMLADLDLLSSSSIETIQLVPVSCIDANLLFGVAMEVLPGFQNDEDRFQEMKGLVYVLLKQLRGKDVALLLQAKSPADAKSEFGQPLHHTCHQTYLLMAQDFPDTTLSQEPSVVPLEASLFRYANANQLISVGSSDLYAPEIEDSALLSQLNDYVDSALDLIPKDSINPLVNEEIRLIQEIEKMTIADELLIGITKETATVQEMDLEEEDNWNDESGIGSRLKSDVGAANTELMKRGNAEDGEWNDDAGVGATTKALDATLATDGLAAVPTVKSVKKPIKKRAVVKRTTPKRKKAREVEPPQKSSIVEARPDGDLGAIQVSQVANAAASVSTPATKAKKSTIVKPVQQQRKQGQRSKTSKSLTIRETVLEAAEGDTSHLLQVVPDVINDSLAVQPVNCVVLKRTQPIVTKTLDVRPSEGSDISEAAPTATLLQSQLPSASSKSKISSTKNSRSSCTKELDDISESASQETLDKMGEIEPAVTQKTGHNAIFDLLTSSDESEDERKDYTGVGAGTNQKKKTMWSLRMVSQAATATKQEKARDTESSSEDDALFSNMFKSSTNKQSPAAAFLQSFDDTDSDAETD